MSVMYDVWDWAVYKDGEKISPHFLTEAEALAYCNEQGLIKISQNEVWYKKGIVVKQVR